MTVIPNEASARHCRAMASILPELARPLEALDLRFLRQAMREKTGFSRMLRSIDQRRLEVGHWPDILEQLQALARQRELGLPLTIDPLKTELETLVDGFAEKDGMGEIPENGQRLRQATALLKTPSGTGLEDLADWTRLLGERDPRTWTLRRLKRVTRQIERSKFISEFRLDKLLFLQFVRLNSTRFGNLIWMLWIPSEFPASPFAWKGNPEENRPLANVIKEAIIETERLNRLLVPVLYDYPRIWRDLEETDIAIEASLNAVISIINACLAPIHEQYVCADDAEVFVRMQQAVDSLSQATRSLLDQIDTHFPRRVNFDTEAREFEDCISRIRLGEVHLGPKVSLWQKIFCPFFNGETHAGWGPTPYEINYLQEIYSITPQTRKITLPA